MGNTERGSAVQSPSGDEDNDITHGKERDDSDDEETDSQRHVSEAEEDEGEEGDGDEDKDKVRNPGTREQLIPLQFFDLASPPGTLTGIQAKEEGGPILRPWIFGVFEICGTSISNDRCPVPSATRTISLCRRHSDGVTKLCLRAGPSKAS